MTALIKRITLRVIKERMLKGEAFADIVADYPKLTEDEIAELKTELGITETGE